VRRSGSKVLTQPLPEAGYWIHTLRVPFFPSPFRRGASCAAARGEVEGETLMPVILTLPPLSAAPSLSRWEREKQPPVEI